ncbi:hypothetical protein [Flindersiella endophytica]
MEIDELATVRDLANSVRHIGGAAEKLLKSELDGIGQDNVREACGTDEMGVQIFEGFVQLAGQLAGAGPRLEQSLVGIGDLISVCAKRIEHTDRHNAEAIKAADLSLQPDGHRLPAAD